MIKISDVVDNKRNIKKIEKKGKVVIIYTQDKNYVVKESSIDNDILMYLRSRNFDYMPEIIKNGKYLITEYIEDLNIPNEQKMIDMIKLISLLHSKTTHYKEIDIDKYESLFDDLNNNLNYLYSYYTDIITIIESKVFMSPSEQLLARNISKIYEVISKNKKKLDLWHNLIKEKTKERSVVLHNNLKLEHFIRNEKSYLISWDKSKIGSPVFDIYKLYINNSLDFDFESLLSIYFKNYPFTKPEKILFDILITMPDIIDFKSSEYNTCQKISKMLDKIYKTEKIISKENFEQR